MRHFTVKTAGGAASQCLALVNSIYVSRVIGRPFRIKHYPYSTGGYFPLAIDPLLKEDEIIAESGQTRGLKLDQVPLVGSIVEEHPLLSKRLSYEKLLMLARKIKGEKIYNFLRNEWSINYSMSRLDNTPKFTRQISGGFFPIIDEEVNLEMHKRFHLAGISSPYSKIQNGSKAKKCVIHYRLGDKRTTYSHSGIQGDGIIDPKSFRKIIENVYQASSHAIEETYVVSDEPDVAQELLRSVGISAQTNFVKGDLWEDLALISQSDVFIGPWSTVSQFALTFLVPKKCEIYFPSHNSRGFRPKWNLENVNYYDPIFLEKSHKIYTANYLPKQDAHKIYGKGPE